MMRLLLRSPAGVLLPGLFAFLLASVSGCKRSAPAGEGEEKQVAPVKAVAARRVPLAEYTELLGGTQPLPQHAARVTAPVEGHVLWVLSDGSGPAVVEGQHVDKGQVIVQLDDRGVRATRDKTRAMLEELQQQKQRGIGRCSGAERRPTGRG